jgi:hypothetical protein
MRHATLCAIAEMDRQAELATADFDAAAAILRAETLPAKRRRALRRLCEEACHRWNVLRYALAYTPAASKRGLLAQIRELGEAALRGDTDQAERLVKVIVDGVESLVPPDARRSSRSCAPCSGWSVTDDIQRTEDGQFGDRRAPR